MEQHIYKKVSFFAIMCMPQLYSLDRYMLKGQAQCALENYFSFYFTKLEQV